MSSKKLSVLIAEDDPDIQTLISYHLNQHHFTPLIANTGKVCLSKIQQYNPDLIILDWMLPEISGIDLLDLLKKDPSTRLIPILMLTAKSTEENKVSALNKGADDYLTKPFSPKELIARVQALLRRSKDQLIDKFQIYKDLRMDEENFEAYRDQSKINLTKLQFKLLSFLMKSPHRVYSRDQIIQNIWEDPRSLNDRAVDTLIARLRKLVNSGYDYTYIHSIRGVGYSLDRD